MRILLDESLPRDLIRVLVTGDRSLEHQQNHATLPIPVVILVAVSNRIEPLRRLIPELLQVPMRIGPGQILHVRTDNTIR